MKDFRAELASDYVKWILSDSVRNWIDELPVHAAAALSSYIGEHQESILDKTEIIIPSKIVATWSNSVAMVLGLPPTAPLGFDLKSAGVFGKPEASLSVRWLRPGKRLPARDVSQDGMWLLWQNQVYRIASPQFEAIELIQQFNLLDAEPLLDKQFAIWAKIRATLGDGLVGQITDHYLRDLHVISPSSFSLAINEDEQGDIQIAPVLLEDNSSDDDLNIQYIQSLNHNEALIFTQRLDQLYSGASAFPLKQGTYVVVDEELQKPLSVVKELRQAPSPVRKRAAMYPEAVLREYLELDDDAPIVFVEIEQFAERVREIGEWIPPLVPWVEVPSEDWGAPIAGGVRIDGIEVPLHLASLEQILIEIDLAIKNNKATFRIKDRSAKATIANREALKQLYKVMNREEITPEEKKQIAKHVLIIETNFNETAYSRVVTNHRPGKDGLPLGLKTTPKSYQEYGIAWMQQHWIQGSKGAMLCDDMGLGKTFQALAFCAWLRDLMIEGVIEKKPILLIAPVGLLRNWEAEIELHLGPDGLGHIEYVYGAHSKKIKKGTHIDGTAALDVDVLAKADVILANYEAVSNYQLSFGTLSFTAIVLDEAQKIKSPQARITHAVKALNSEFMLAMTGTPIENRLADLWCIADAVQPGVLFDLKSFSSQFESEEPDFHSLHEKVWHDEGKPLDGQHLKMLLRRLKNDKLDGLPQKHEYEIEILMPERQLEAYHRVLSLKEHASKYSTLEMIQSLRQVSLHPVLYESSFNDEPLQIDDSSRFIALLQILDAVSKLDEKVLIFLESLDLQGSHQLPLLLQRRYGLHRPPMVINGQVKTVERQRRVDLFQKEKGFDIMILSPKAGGVGLTLTAANHVIHLSRWWNPAVEDQCSDRVYRIGQTKPVHIYYPLAVLPTQKEKSFDIKLQNLMDRKRKIAKNLLTVPVFSTKDYEDLLSDIQSL